MKIIYIENLDKKCNYYTDLISSLKVENDVIVIKNNFDEVIKTFDPDVIIIGFSITDCGDNAPSLIINLKTNTPVYVILNKEYTGLTKKLDWIKKIHPKVSRVFSVHHETSRFQSICDIPFTRIMWSANQNIFKKYDDEYKYDFFFSGVIRQEQTNNLREKIYDKLNELSAYNLLVKVAFFKKNTLHGDLYSLKNDEYAKTINHSKIVLTTTGPADLVGTRYFEIMASNKALIMCNRMPQKVYEDIVIDKTNCVMFDDEYDFVNKCKYYLENEEERMKIVHKAYEYFLERHTWDHKVKHLTNYL